MRIVVAPDKFKGSLSAKKVAAAIGRGAAQAVPGAEIDLIPMADGGEGTVETLAETTGGRRISVAATDPLGRPCTSCFGLFKSVDGVKTAIIEMAAASGLWLVASENKPMQASTYGTGELILAALEEKCGRLIIGLGGSATTDGGTGMAAALGACFRDSSGEPLPPGGGELIILQNIDLSGLDSRLKKTEILVACDVDNPLYGPNGAAHVYGPQKGATPAQVEILDAGLKRLSDVVMTDLGIDVAQIPGGGAAGGLGAGLVAFAGASLRSGVDLISDTIGLSARLAGADLVITGEGCIDNQSACGKTPVGVARLAKAAGIPAIAIVGSIGPGAEIVFKHGIQEIVPLRNASMTDEEAMKNVEKLLEDATRRAVEKRG